MSPCYPLLSGTTIGEIRNEVYCHAGASAYETAHYGWHHEHITNYKTKIYTMVNTSPVKFLIATIDTNNKFEKIISGSPAPVILPGKFDFPEVIDFVWVDTELPFLEKDKLDAMGISYSL